MTETKKTRNYGLGSRDMGKAGQFLLNNEIAKKHMPYASAATITGRWKKFSTFMDTRDIKTMEQVDQKLVIQYGNYLADLVDIGDLSAAYAQNLISAVNTVMYMATLGDWKTISPTADCNIPERKNVRTIPPTGLDREKFYVAIENLSDLKNGQAAAILAREFGLRAKEAALFDANKALNEARKNAIITIKSGTKGGRPRTIPIQESAQLEALHRAALIQGKKRSLIPKDLTWSKFRDGELRKTRDKLRELGIKKLHDLRAAYACERYEKISGYPSPLLGGNADRDSDKTTRLQIALELGHGRIDVTNAYVGGRTCSHRK